MKRILIVDDALDLGRLWQAAIKAAAPELEIVVVPSAEEALLEANYHSIDLLITDIRLPGELVGRVAWCAAGGDADLCGPHVPALAHQVGELNDSVCHGKLPAVGLEGGSPNGCR